MIEFRCLYLDKENPTYLGQNLTDMFELEFEDGFEHEKIPITKQLLDYITSILGWESKIKETETSLIITFKRNE